MRFGVLVFLFGIISLEAVLSSVAINPQFQPAHFLLAGIYSELGREDEARAAAAEVLPLNPKFSLEVHKERVPIKDPAMRERYIAALRRAGLK